MPDALERMIATKDPAGNQRVLDAIMKMKKLDLAALKRAHDGRARLGEHLARAFAAGKR